MPVGEVVSYMVGQCGVQTGSAIWNLYGSEHGIGPTGFLIDPVAQNDFSFNSFYKECNGGAYVPRTVFIDLEPTVIEEIKTGITRNLYHDDSLIYSFEDAANNFARGFYTCGRLLIKEVVFSTRKQVEACGGLKAFFIHHSYGGGTGSGFMSMLMEYLSTEYGKICKLDLGLIPNETLSCCTVEPYNGILGLHHPMESTDLAFVYENEPLYNVCKTKLRLNQPLFPQLNEIVSQIMSGITACTRFESPLGCTLIEMQTSIVPYPRIHFPLVTFAPLALGYMDDRSINTTEEITKSAFHQSNQLVSVESNEGKVMANCLIYRGPVSGKEVYETINTVKRSKGMEWVDWSPTGFKIGITMTPITNPAKSFLGCSKRSVTLLKNSTVIRTVFNRLGQKFWQLFSRKAFIHWFIGEGMEEKEFQDAFDDLMLLSNDLNLLEKGNEELDEAELTMLYPKEEGRAPNEDAGKAGAGEVTEDDNAGPAAPADGAGGEEADEPAKEEPAAEEEANDNNILRSHLKNKSNKLSNESKKENKKDSSKPPKPLKKSTKLSKK